MNYGIDQQVFPHHADATIVIPALASSFLFPDGYSALSAPVVAGHDVFEALPPPVPAGPISGLIPRVGPSRRRLPLLLVFTDLAAALPP